MRKAIMVIMMLMGMAAAAEVRITQSETMTAVKTSIRCYNDDYLATGTFDDTVMTNYFITVTYDIENDYSRVTFTSVGVNAETFWWSARGNFIDAPLDGMDDARFDRIWNRMRDRVMAEVAIYGNNNINGYKE